jgi:hypothetical protein
VTAECAAIPKLRSTAAREPYTPRKRFDPIGAGKKMTQEPGPVQDQMGTLAGWATGLVCSTLIVAGYLVYFGTWWGDPLHGPGGKWLVAREATVVLAAYSGLELLRRGNVLGVAGLPFLLIFFAEAVMWSRMYMRYSMP